MKSELRHYLLEECYAMVKHLSADGKNIPLLASSLLTVDQKDCDEIALSDQDIIKLHNELTKKIAPARPKTIWLLHKEAQKKDILKFLGPVVLVKRLMLVALISLVLFIAISLSKYINSTYIDDTIFDNSGLSLFIVLAFYLTSASLGAAFSNLFQANKYILNNTFDPKYETSYWIRFVLGIMAGFVLAVVIPMPKELGAGGASNITVFSRPLLAMLGGFSASLVYRILFRLVYAVESVFIGKQDDKTEAKIANLQAANDLEKEGDKQKLVNQLLNLQALVSQGKSSDELNNEIKNAIENISNN